MIDQLMQIMSDWPLITLAVGLFVLLWGGNKLVDSSIVIAQKAGLSKLVIGLTIVSFGTSAPELSFNIIAALNGNGDLSFGNIVGSNIANIALVLGICAVTAPLVIHSRLLRKELPILILISILMLAMGVFVPHVKVDLFPNELGGLTDVHGFSREDGLFMMLLFVLFVWIMYRLTKSNHPDYRVEMEAPETQTDEQSTDLSFTAALFWFVIGLVLLTGGGKLSEIGAIGVAKWLGLSQVVIGLTVVAIATSLPEVATSLIAAKKGHADLAVGNVVGSNIFNILLVMGATSIIAPVQLPDMGTHDLVIMTAITAFLLVLIVLCKEKIPRAGGVLLLVFYVGYLAWTVMR